MKNLNFLLFTALLICACSKDSGDEAGECKLTELTHGPVLTDQKYTIIYEEDLITELSGDTESIKLSYDSDGYLVNREFFISGDPRVQFRNEFSNDSAGQLQEVKRWRLENDELIYLGKETYHYSGSKLTEINRFNSEDTFIQSTFEIIWTDENPTTFNLVRSNGEIDYSTTLTYDLSRENKFNTLFPDFRWYDFFSTDFSIYQSLGKNVLTSASSTFDPADPTIEIYVYTFYPNGLTDEVMVNRNLWWKFEYACE